jgi:hypothetical protein
MAFRCHGLHFLREILRCFADQHSAAEAAQNAEENRDRLPEWKRTQANQERPHGEDGAWEIM